MWRCFYPRHPRGWRLRVAVKPQLCIFVSIHATLAGGDQKNMGLPIPACMFLSTPPSRVATVMGLEIMTSQSSFYPRHPRGWRPPKGYRAERLTMFLSTPPSRVATCVKNGRAAEKRSFYPRHPRGWRRDSEFLKAVDGRFLSTPPSRVATRHASIRTQIRQVSIHATLAGGDHRTEQGGRH